MRVDAGRAALVRLWCWLYIGVGLCSLAFGFYMLALDHRLGSETPPGAGIIAFVLIIFGPLRIANSARVLFRLRKRTAS